MNCKIEKIVVLSLGTTAKTVRVHGLACLIQNNSDSATVYFKDERDDGKKVTSANGFALAPGKTTEVPMVAMDLSLVASADSTDVRVLILEEA